MATTDKQDDASLLADAMRRAAALHDALDRDRASLAGSARWPEGPALYADAITAVDRVIRELGAPADVDDDDEEDDDEDDRAHRSESPPP